MHYTGTIWRPPYEAYSLLVQVTAGCTHHSCKFCTLYEDLPFKFKLSPFSEVKADLAEASKYYRKIPRIFFTGANPFVLSTEKLKTLAKMVKEYYPFYKTIGCFARITDIMPKSLEELKELRALGYDGITIGVETGDDESLTFMNKGFQSKDVLEQCRKLDEAGISYNFFYLTGIYGVGRGEVGAKKTAMLFNQLNPKIIESSMLTIYKTSELYQEIQKGNWKEESEIEKLIELKTLVEKLKTEDTRDAINIAKCDITDLGYYQNIMKAIKTLNEMMMSGKASLIDNEMYLEILNQNPLCKPEDVKDYRKVRSALAVQHVKDKSNPVYAFALALNYRTFGVNPKNMKKSNILLQRLSTRKLSKTFLEYRGPNVREDYSISHEKFSPILSY